MKKFDNIHNKQTINEGDITLFQYVEALSDLKDGLTNKKNSLKSIGDIKENVGVATLGSVNGMSAVQLPPIDGIGSGDMLGAIGATNEVGKLKKQKQTKPLMKKFETIKEEREINESELYIPIIQFADPSRLISFLSKELSKKYSAKETEVSRELINIEISYNGLVNIFTLDKLSDILDKKPKEIKSTIDSLINKNIGLLENMQVELITKFLNNPKSINESFLGRLVGGVAGFTFGPSVGRIIAKVLGVEQGPLYNILTSRVVSAALAQELTKNII